MAVAVGFVAAWAYFSPGFTDATTSFATGQFIVAGDMIVTFVSSYDSNGAGAITAVSDSSSNTYSAARFNRASGTGDTRLACYDTTVEVGGEAMSVSCSATPGSDLTICALQLTGTSITFDQQNSGTGSSTSASSGSITPTAAAMCLGAATTWGTPGQTWTGSTEQTTNNTALTTCASKSSSSSETATFSSGSSGEWCAGIVSYTEGGAPPAIPPGTIWPTVTM